MMLVMWTGGEGSEAPILEGWEAGDGGDSLWVKEVLVRWSGDHARLRRIGIAVSDCWMLHFAYFVCLLLDSWYGSAGVRPSEGLSTGAALRA